MGDESATEPQTARIVTGGFRLPQEHSTFSESTQRLTGHIRSARASQHRRFGAPPAERKKEHDVAQRDSSKSSPGETSSKGAGLWERTEKRHLELNMTSLQEAYARKIAETELRCEEQLLKAEGTREDWFKKKKIEIGKIRAGVVVMQALFERRKRKFLKQMQEDREEFEQRKKQMEEELRDAKEETARIRRESAKTIAEMEKAHEKAIAEAKERELEVENRAMRAERAGEKLEKERNRLHEVEKGLKMEVEDLRLRLKDAERAEELQRRTEQVEALQEELRRTRQRMKDRKNAEAEELRKELMEYVKFIVRIIPDDWRAKLRPELMQRLEPQGQPLEELPETASLKAMRDLSIAVGEWQMPEPTTLPPVLGNRGSIGRS